MGQYGPYENLSYSSYLLGGDLPSQRKKKTDERVKGTEEEELNRQINRQMEELKLRGDTTPHLNPALSIFSRVGDLLSRGNYASAEMYDASRDAENEGEGFFGQIGEGLKGFGRGITGHDKTTYHDVLKEHGLPFTRGHPMHEGKPTAALGFLLDVGLDPTTYLSLGSVPAAKAGLKEGVEVGAKEATETIAEAAAKRATSEAVEASVKRGSQRNLREAAKLHQSTAAGRAYKTAYEEGQKNSGKLIKDALEEGLISGEKTNIKNATKVSNTIIAGQANEAALLANDAVREATKGTFGLKVLGKPVLQSEKLYSVGERINQSLVGNVIGRDVGKLFSTRHLFPGPLRTLKREAEGFATAHADDTMREIDDVFRKLPKVDQRRIADSIELGQDLSNEITSKAVRHKVPRMVNGEVVKDEFGRVVTDVINEPINMGMLQKRYKELSDGFLAEQLGNGTLKHEVDPVTGEIINTDLLQNYVYHFYRSNNRSAVGKFKALRKKVQNVGNPGKSITIKTLEEAEKLGLKPVREAGDILKLQAGKHYKEIGRVKYATAVGSEFGIELTEKMAKSLPEDTDLVKVTNKYLKGANDLEQHTYLPKRVNEALNAMDGLYDNAEEANRLLRYYDKGLAAWKFGNTAPNPGHHIRNLLGDMHNNWLDGVVNPHRYTQAADVLRGNPKTKLKIGNNTLTAPEIVSLYKDYGVKSGYTRVEIGARRFRPTQKIMEFAETREDFARMAHFIDSLKKEADGVTIDKGLATPKLREAASRASARVREFNIDYGDLTDFEKKYMKRAVPFYTWNRKNIPLQLKSLAFAPGRQAVVPKGMRALQEIQGIDPESGEYPTIGGLQTVPKWLRDVDGIQILGEGQGRHGVYYDPSVVLPSLGAADIIDEPLAQLISGHPGGAKDAAAQELVNQLNPVAKNVIESATGINTFTGGKNETGFINDVTKQNPIARLIVKQARGEADKYDWINWAGGTSLRDIGEKETLSEYRRQQDLLEAPLERTGGRAAAMLASMPLEEFAPRVDLRDEESVVEAKTRLLHEMEDLQAGGRGLSLLKQKEKLQKYTNESRVNSILKSYASYSPHYEAFMSV